MIASDRVVEKLCREIYRETGEFYDRIRPRLRNKAFGYKILYDPPLVHAPIVLVGLNPGGVSMDQNKGRPLGHLVNMALGLWKANMQPEPGIYRPLCGTFLGNNSSKNAPA